MQTITDKVKEQPIKRIKRTMVNTKILESIARVYMKFHLIALVDIPEFVQLDDLFFYCQG